jgi:hypothetical protein
MSILEMISASVNTEFADLWSKADLRGSVEKRGLWDPILLQKLAEFLENPVRMPM